MSSRGISLANVRRATSSRLKRQKGNQSDGNGVRDYYDDGGQPMDDAEDLLVFGYHCTLFRDDEKALLDHLISLPFETETTIDRFTCTTSAIVFDFVTRPNRYFFLTEIAMWMVDDLISGSRAKALLSSRMIHDSLFDCRLLLSNSIDLRCDPGASPLHLTLEQQEEEHWCDEERYKDLKSLENASEEAKITEFNGVAIPYDYNARSENETSISKETAGEASASSSEDDDSFIPSVELRVPPDMITPTSTVQNAVILKTAVFVNEKGPQLEIIINAKQKSNKRFRFLDFENPLHKYYKHVLKMVREKKYTPDLSTLAAPKKKKKIEKAKLVESENSGSDSDEDGHYLHPSLLAAHRKVEPSSTATSVPVAQPSQPTIQTVSYKIGEENDVYSELYNRLLASIPKKEEQNVENGQKVTNQEPAQNFDGWPSEPRLPLVPPPPDLQPVIDRLADYVARNGPEFELLVRRSGTSPSAFPGSTFSQDPIRFAFLNPEHAYYAYYYSRLQWHRYVHYVASFYGMPAEYVSAQLEQQQQQPHQNQMIISEFSSETPYAVANSSSSVAQSTLQLPFTLPFASDSSSDVIATVDSISPIAAMRPFEKNGEKICFSLKSKDKQHTGDSNNQPSISESEHFPLDQKVDSAFCTPSTSKAPDSNTFMALDGELLLENGSTFPIVAGYSSKIDDESLKIDRRKRARMFLDSLKSAKLKSSLAPDDSSGSSSKKTTVIIEKKFSNSSETTSTVKKRRFDVVHKT